MKTNDFNAAITSKQLNETMFKKFGTRVDFEKYTREQLEDYRNKLRTKVSQTEGSAGFNDLLSNEGYQQDKHLLNLLNTRIKEMLGEAKEVVLEKAKSKKQQKFMGMVYAAKKGKKPASKEVAKAAKGMSKKAAKDFAKTKHKGLPKKVKEEAGVAFNARPDRHRDDNLAGAETQKDENRDPVPQFPRTKRAVQNRINAVNAAQAQLDAQTLRPKRPEQSPEAVTAARIAKQKEIAQQIYDAERAARDDAANRNRPAGTPPVRPIKLLTRENNMKTNEAKKAKPDYIDIDGDGNKKEPMKAAANSMRKKTTTGGPFGKGKAKPAKPKKDTENPFAKGKGPKSKTDNSKGKNPFAKNKKKAKVGESKAHHYAVILEGLKRYLREDEEGKAKDITAGSDMVNDFTSWMQRVGQYQTKSMIELADSIRSNFGAAEADAFKNAIQPALQSSLEALTASREVITKAVAVLAGEESAETPMGSDADLGLEEPVEGDVDSMNMPPEQEVGVDDEFAASDAAVGGRETRENRQFKKLRKLEEAHSIMRKLAG